MTPENFEELKKKLQNEGRLTIKLVSNSMSPVLPTGAVASIEPVSYNQIQNLDFIVFHSNEILVCHAVWRLGYFKDANGERTIITRGIATPHFDLPVSESRILGRVTSHRISRKKFYWLALKSVLYSRLGFVIGN